jgi:phosphatidylinositol alpha-1,6-mannosyltransferase
MEKVNQHLLAALAPEWRLSLCGPQGCGEFAPEGAQVREVAIRPLPVFLSLSAVKAVLLALNSRPSLILAGSGLAAPMAWAAARLTGARLAVYLHGLDIIAPSRIYQTVWLPFIRSSDVVLVNSENTSRLARNKGITGDRITVLHPGTDIPETEPSAGPSFRARHGLGQRKLLLSVGRFTRRKGLAEFVARCLPELVVRWHDIMLLVIGEEALDALHGVSGGERERILAIARSANVGDNIHFLGRCDEAALQAAYQAADCHVFPVLDVPGDVEGFGMVALESAANGLPTVAFAVGGVPDAVGESRSGMLVRSGDYAAFREAVAAILATPRNEATTQGCREFASDKSWDRFGERLRERLRP